MSLVSFLLNQFAHFSRMYIYCWRLNPTNHLNDVFITPLFHVDTASAASLRLFETNRHITYIL